MKAYRLQSFVHDSYEFCVTRRQPSKTHNSVNSHETVVSVQQEQTAFQRKNVCHQLSCYNTGFMEPVNCNKATVKPFAAKINSSQDSNP